MDSTEPINDMETMIWTTMSMVTNMTMPEPNRRLEILTLLSRITGTSSLVLIMIMMGCTIDIGNLKETFRRPYGFAIGMVSQFVLMPLIAFCLALALQLETAGALSLLILACCPGGTLSNIFTYYVNGDVCLSVGMTTVSSTAAIGMMPLNLFIYSRVWTDQGAVIPYVDIIVTLVSICIPAMFGIGLRYYRTKWADKLHKIASVLSILFVCMGVPMPILINPNFFLAGWGVWVAGAILPMVGYVIGYGFAVILRLSHRKCRAIAFETGSQNVTLALTLTLMSFAGTDLFIDMLFLPTIYLVFIFVDSIIVIFVYRVYLRCHTDNDTSASGLDLPEIEADSGDKTGQGSNGYVDDAIRGVYTKHVELGGNGVMKSSSICSETGHNHVDDHDNSHGIVDGGGVSGSSGNSSKGISNGRGCSDGGDFGDD